MANPNFSNQPTSQSQSQLLFPSARAMKQTSTTIASGVVPGVNTLISPTVRQTQLQYPAVAPVVAASHTATKTRAKALVAPHSLTEEQVLQQKVFAARLLGAPVNIAGQIAVGSAGAVVTNQGGSVSSTVAPVPQQQAGFPNGIQQQQQQQLPQQMQGTVITGAALSSAKQQQQQQQQFLPDQQHQQQQFLPGQQHQHQFQQGLQGQQQFSQGQQQQQFPQGQQQLQQQQQFLPGQQFMPGQQQQQFLQGQQQQFPQGQQQQQQHQQGYQQQRQQQQPGNFSSAHTGKGRQKKKSGPRWGGNGGNSNQNVVHGGSVRGAFGKAQEIRPAWQAETAVNTGPGILGPYPASQSFETPTSNLNQQSSYYNAQPMSVAVTTTYSSPSVGTSMVSSTFPAAAKPSIQQQQLSFRETLQGLNPFEMEKLRKALLSGKTETLGFTSAQALDILQAMKSISSDKTQPAQKSVDRRQPSGDWPETISTNWPGTADDDWKGPGQAQVDQPKSTDQSRGLSSILEYLRSSKGFSDEIKSGDSVAPRDDTRSRQSRWDTDDSGYTSFGDNHVQLQSDVTVVRLQSNFVPAPNNVFATGMATSDGAPLPIGIPFIDDNLQMPKNEKEKILPGQHPPGRHKDDHEPTGKQRRTNDKGRSRSRERHDTRHAGDRSERADPKHDRLSDRDRDRRSDRIRERGRDQPRGERHTSRENDRGRSPSNRRNEDRKRSHNSPPRREKARSSSRERKDRGRRSASRERRNRRHPSNDRQGPVPPSRRGDSPERKRRRSEEASKPPRSTDTTSGRAPSTRTDQATKTSSNQQKMDTTGNKKSEKQDEKPSGAAERSRQSQEERRNEVVSPRSTQVKPMPLLDLVIPKRAKTDWGSFTCRITPGSAPTSKSSAKPAEAKSEAAKAAKSSTSSSGSDPKAKMPTGEEKAKKKKEETKLTVEEASKVAASMKDTPLVDQIGEGSIQHQLSLLKEVGLDEHVKDKEIVDWYCYICGKFCTVWSIYLSHVEGRKHKALFQRLHEIGHAALKKTLIAKLSELPEKGKGDPEKWIKIRQPSFAQPPPVQPIVTSTPLGKLDQAFFCGRCFRTYACSYEEHMASEDHKRYEKIRPKCTLCNLTFLNLKCLRRHMTLLPHIKKAQESGIDTSTIEIKDDIDWQKEEGEEERGESDEGQDSTDKTTATTQQKKKVPGVEFIIPISGYFCKLCSKFYNKEKTARDVHCLTDSHKQKVKKYYEKRIKTSVASLKASPGISVSEKKPLSSAATKSSWEQDATLRKDAQSRKDAPPKDALPKKDGPPKRDALPNNKTAVSNKDATPNKNATPKRDATPSKDATPKRDATPGMDVTSKRGATPSKDTKTKKDAPPSENDKNRADLSQGDNTKDKTAAKTGAPRDTSSKEPTSKETPPKMSSPKLVLSIPKMSPSSIAAINGLGTKDSNEAGSVSTSTPKLATPKAVTPKEATPKEATPKTASRKSSSSEAKDQFKNSAEDRSNATSKTSEVSDSRERDRSKQGTSRTAAPRRASEESATPKSNSKEPDSSETEASETGTKTAEGDQQEDDWMEEMPDFDNMIFIDEVGESDEEEGADGSTQEGEEAGVFEVESD